MGVGGVGWGDGATGVVVGDIGVPKECVGFPDRRDPRQAEFFDESVLVGLKATLNATLGLGAQSEDHLDCELFHGAGELGEWLFLSQLLFDGGVAVDLVDGVPIYVKGHRPAVEQEIGLDGLEEV